MGVRGIETHNGKVVINDTLTLGGQTELKLKDGTPIWSGKGDPNGEIDPWLSAPIGSIYIRTDPPTFAYEFWYKIENGEWCCA